MVPFVQKGTENKEIYTHLLIVIKTDRKDNPENKEVGYLQEVGEVEQKGYGRDRKRGKSLKQKTNEPDWMSTEYYNHTEEEIKH